VFYAPLEQGVMEKEDVLYVKEILFLKLVHFNVQCVLTGHTRMQTEQSA